MRPVPLNVERNVSVLLSATPPSTSCHSDIMLPNSASTSLSVPVNR